MLLSVLERRPPVRTFWVAVTVLLQAGSATVFADESSVSNLAEKVGAAVEFNLQEDGTAGDKDADAESESDEPRVVSSAEELTRWTDFDVEPLAEAKAALASRKYRQALKLLEGKTSLPARYLKATAQARMGATRPAAEALIALSSEWPLLSDICVYEAGQLFERTRDWNRAVAAYREVPTDSRLFVPARLRWSRIEKRRRRFESSLEALTGILSAGPPAGKAGVQPTLWLDIADLARLLGDYNGEHRALLATWALHPQSPQASVAQRRLVGLPYPPKWKLARAETLLSMNLHADALRALEPLLKIVEGDESLHCRAQFALGTVFRKERQHAKALSVLRPVVARCGNQEIQPRALYILGYSESVVDATAAIATYERLEREFPDYSLSDDALFYAGELRRRRGDWEGARATFVALVDRHPGGDFVPQALFARFWLSRQQGAVDVSPLAKIESLPSAQVSHEQVQRARYWRARTLMDSDKAAEGLSLFARVREEGGNTYYGLLATKRLAEMALEPSAANTKARLGDAITLLETHPELERGLTLFRLGHAEAGSALTSGLDRRSSKELWALYSLMTATGRKGTARVMARALLKTGGEALAWTDLRRLYEAAYPRAFRPLIERYSRSAGISPDLLQALVREESAFNPKARSTTGALGLAQLMPQTAERVAQGMGLNVSLPLGLYEPRHNLRLGSAYLGELQRRWSGNWVYTVASYNAGPAAVGAWLRRLPDLQLDEWVEEVPVEETRNYVKRVLGSFAAYQQLTEAEGKTTARANNGSSSSLPL